MSTDFRTLEWLSNAVNLLSKAFENDPVITYMLGSMRPEKRVAYLPKYFDALLTAAALNKATFEEVDDWSSCSVMMPPGHRVDNPLTMLPSGIIPLLWNVGIKGCSVGWWLI